MEGRHRRTQRVGALGRVGHLERERIRDQTVAACPSPAGDAAESGGVLGDAVHHRIVGGDDRRDVFQRLTAVVANADRDVHRLIGVGVGVGGTVGVLVAEGVYVVVGVAESVGVGVLVGSGVSVSVKVGVSVGVSVCVGVDVSVSVGV